MNDFTEGDLRLTQRFLGRLARRLSADEHTAEDLVQDTWVASLRHPRAVARGPYAARGWFARVLHSRAINRALADRSRSDREAAAARGEAAPPVPNVEEELEVGRRVLAAVDELPEAQRRAILLRYWHDMKPGAIARKLGVPVATVKTRLASGRAQLRSKLDRSYGSREAWALALLPLGESAPAIPFSLEGSLASSLLRVGAAAAVVAAGWAGWIGVQQLRTDGGRLDSESSPAPVVVETAGARDRRRGLGRHDLRPSGDRWRSARARRIRPLGSKCRRPRPRRPSSPVRRSRAPCSMPTAVASRASP